MGQRSQRAPRHCPPVSAGCSPWAPTPAPRLRWRLTLGIAPFREVLALHDLLYDVISINARVIHPGRVALHRVLLPPGVGRESEQSHDHRTSPVYRTQDPPSARGRWSRVCSLNRHINPTVRMLLQPDFREEAAEALGSEVPASKRPQSMEAGWPQGMLDHPKHPPTEHARQARCSQCGASARLTATHPRTTGPSCPCYKWRSRGSGSHWRALLSSSTCGETYRNERSDRCGGRGGRGGFSGGRCSRSLPSGPSTAMLRPPEVLLLVDVFRRCVRSERLEERDCSVL